MGAFESEKRMAMGAKLPLPGPGMFQWNTGGWFGTQIEGTAWMLGGLVAVFQAPVVTAVFLLGFLVVNVAGSWLWRHRDQIPPFRAIQILAGLIWVCGMLALVSMDLARSGMTSRAELRQGYFYFLVIMPEFMAGCYLLEERVLKSKMRAAGRS